MTTKTLNLNIELCDSGAILSYPDDGCKYAYSDETEVCRSIANDIAHCRGNNCPLKESCHRFELYCILEKVNLNNIVFFTIEQYDQKTNKCKLYIPIKQ